LEAFSQPSQQYKTKVRRIELNGAISIEKSLSLERKLSRRAHETIPKCNEKSGELN
jgi:hypothetical protein